MKQIALATLLACSVSAFAQVQMLQTAQGSHLALRVDLPPGDGRVNALVLAPGQGYHMGMPLMETVTRAALARGLAVFRFNWTYYSRTPRGTPSADLSLELRDMQAVIAHMREHPRVNAQGITVAGKSLGSVVAWRAWSADPQLRAAVLLTPVCTQGGSQPVAAQNYPLERAAQARPVLFIAGHRDPLCHASTLLDFSAQAGPQARAAIVGGDHNFEYRELPADKADASRQATLDAVAAITGAFLEELQLDVTTRP